jgi:hypothetical protein
LLLARTTPPSATAPPASSTGPGSCGGPADVHPRHGVGPQHKADRRRRDPEEDGRADGPAAGLRQGMQRRTCPGQHEHGPGPHGIGGDLEAGVPAEQRFLRGVEDRLQDRGGQHDQGRGAEAQPAGGGDGRGAGQRYRGARPLPARLVLAQEGHRQQAGVDRGGRDEQAGGARGHHPLTGVEQQLVSRHPGQPAHGDQRQVRPPRTPDTQERSGHQQGRGRDSQPDHRQPGRAERANRDADGGKGAGPQQHSPRGRQACEFHIASLVPTSFNVQLQNLI